MLRSAKLSIEQGIDLPKSPAITIVGKGKDGKAVCQLFVNATGVSIAGPKGGIVKSFYWEDLLALAENALIAKK
jgi:hypothetical protein